MKKILVPVDFSKPAAHAMYLALQLAEKKHFMIDVVHVVEFPVGSVVDPMGLAVMPMYDKDLLELLKEKAQGQMDKFLAPMGNIDKVNVIIEIGNAYATLAENLISHDYEFVIMGTKGATGFKEFFVGSNTEKVVRNAKCPVFAVHKQVNMENIKDIAFATLGPEITEDLMLHVKQLQDLLNAHLHIVRINTPNSFKRDALVKKSLKDLAERHMLKNYVIDVYNDMYEDQGIIAYAEECGADMIAMGTHGRKGIGHFLTGSLAEDVVNHASQVIWTYHIKK